MSTHQGRRVSAIRPRNVFECAVATAYDQAGDDYIAYADGDPEKLFDFDGHYAYGDRCIWEILEAKLGARRASGARSVRILDLGCGPGTWLRRTVMRAHTLGFDEIVAHGIDIAGAQVRRARELSKTLSGLAGVDLSYEIGDMFAPVAEAASGVDLCLCLCGVLNHLPAPALSGIFAEIARVTNGSFITTARAVGSTPSIYVDAIDRARRFRQDNRTNRLDVEFENGQHISLPSHLFAADELRALVSPHLDIEDLRGIDLFHGRFARDPRWNPTSPVNTQFEGELDQLEKAYCRDAEFIDYATHLLLIGSRRTAEAIRSPVARECASH